MDSNAHFRADIIFHHQNGRTGEEKFYAASTFAAKGMFAGIDCF